VIARSPGSGNRISAGTVAALRAAGLDPDRVCRVVETALAEDLRYGPDVTTLATVPAGTVAVAQITPRTAGVLAGSPVALAVFDAVLGSGQADAGQPGADGTGDSGAAGGAGYEVLAAAGDGTELVAGRPALVLRGPVQGLLTAERTALNFLCHLSGIATLTARWVAAVAGTGAVVRDTRKTLPGLRELEKYAVRCGGGTNHRMGLGDSALIKDNHIEAAGSVAAAIAAVRASTPALSASARSASARSASTLPKSGLPASGLPASGLPASGLPAFSLPASSLHCEVEVDDLTQLGEAVAAGAAEVLLDNFTPAECAQAVRLVRQAGAATRLEASGGLTLETARTYAETGVDFLAVGALTHSAPYLDLGMDLVACGSTG
jgi:nicotinate-nucleotide pyrophosphorylase (carboxylating)